MTGAAALLTDRRFVAARAADGDWYLENILHEDRLLQAELARLGLASQRVDWSRPNQDWSQFRCAVFRTTWDYFDRFDEFSEWLDRGETQTQLCNPPAVVRWNMDKHYLGDLDGQGIPVVPTRFLERGTSFKLRDLLDDAGWDEAVLKPCVSGAARHTYRVSRANAAEIDAVAQRLINSESLLLQPFERGVVEHGEDSLMVFDSQFSHAVRKVAKAGDFRVQDDHGGTVHPYNPGPAQIELAEHAMAACPRQPVYGRVDMIQTERGDYAVMELELIEPELWLRFFPPAAAAFAQAIAAYCQEDPTDPRPASLGQ